MKVSTLAGSKVGWKAVMLVLVSVAWLVELKAETMESLLVVSTDVLLVTLKVGKWAVSGLKLADLMDLNLVDEMEQLKMVETMAFETCLEKMMVEM